MASEKVIALGQVSKRECSVVMDAVVAIDSREVSHE